MTDLSFLDTNVLIRYLTRDNPVQAELAYSFLQTVAQDVVRVTTTEAVIAEVVHVLSSKLLYNVPRSTIRQRLNEILDLRGLRLPNKAIYRRALELYEVVHVDFVDCLVAARMEAAGITTVVSFDSHFDRLPGITRQEPGGLGGTP